MATLATQVIPNEGLSPTYDPATDTGDKCATGEGVFLHVKNAGAAAHTVTLVTPQTVQGDLAVDDRSVTVAASGEQMIPVDNLYRDPSDGLASITYDSVEAGFDLAVLRI